MKTFVVTMTESCKLRPGIEGGTRYHRSVAAARTQETEEAELGGHLVVAAPGDTWPSWEAGNQQLAGGVSFSCQQLIEGSFS